MATKRQKPSTKPKAKPKSTPKPARYQGSAFLRDISRAVDEGRRETAGLNEGRE